MNVRVVNPVIASKRPDTRTIALGVAGVLAVGTGLLTYNYLTAVGAHASAPEVTRAVVVAAREIPAHTTITAEMLRRVARPASGVDPDVFEHTAEAAGGVTAGTIPAGSAITRSRLLHASALSVGQRLRPGTRAVAIALDKVRGVSGLVQPGDIVDVIAVTGQRGSAAPRAATIVRAARVLSVGTALDPGATNPADGTSMATATLELTPAQTATVTLADLNATLRLALHDPRDRAVDQNGDRLDLSIPEPARPAAPAPAPMMPLAPPQPAARPPVAAPKPKPAVAIIDGATLLP